MAFVSLHHSRRSIMEETGALLKAFPSLGAVDAESEILRRRRARNLSQIIHRLPTELLILIFREVVHVAENELFTRKKSDGLMKLRCIAGVSSRWKGIVKGSPGLWKVVDGRDAPRSWSRVLSLSKGAPIMVSLPPAPHFDVKFWEAISEAVVRWQSARLWLTSDTDLSPLGMYDAPVLTRIDLARSGDNSKAVDLFRGVAPRLQDLKLTKTSLLNWDSPFLSSARLRALSLNRIDSSGPSVQQIAHTLCSCNALEELSLWMISYKHEAAASPPTQARVISLPNLRDLTVYPVTSEFVNRILQLLNTPNCSKITLGSTIDVPITPCAEYISPLLKAALAAAARISLTFDSWGCRIEVHYLKVITERPSFSARVLAESTELATDWALGAFGRTLARLTTSITLEGLPPFSLQYFLTLLRRLPSIQTLRLRGGHVCAVLDLLGAARESPADSWVCPKLENLYFEHCSYCRADDIWNLVDARERAARTGMWLEIAGIKKVMPTKLKILDISHWSKMDGETFRKIEGKLGRIVARWHRGQAIQSDQMEVDAPGNSDLEIGGPLYPIADDGHDL
ncbi:hypothetical protein FRB96_002939 [Tulasnella sp. 330]|nr:hypothetical protein FRB96_002939 [Tulasnella sp. 330]KAG8870203.1 hypothetical protein FRB97_000236 [Tulasnella sp. 331]KAG8872629.1 hypothetical protein FRB98_009506 [Tulasnella sp. 332]